MVNLVGNALKFTDRGHVVVDLSAKPGAKRGRCTLQITVSDTGSGISPAQRDRLFLPFVQGDGSCSRRHGGSGLGLSIVEQLVDLMRGTIEVESSEGSGSVFTVQVDVAVRTANGLGLVPLPWLTGPAPLRALVFEPDKAYREVILGYLQSWGIQGEAVGTAFAGLSALLASAPSHPFNVVLLADVKTEAGTLDSIELATIIKSDAALRALPLVLLTDLDDAQRATEAVLQGVSAFVRKPVQRRQLYDIIAMTLNASPPPAADRLPREIHSEETSGTTDEAGLVPGGVVDVLIVEDNEVNQLLALQQLKHLGFRAEVARNGRDALTALENRVYSLVLMDCQMPEMDGYEATREWRRRECERGGHVPIVAMTANALDGDSDACFAAGMDGYLPKPIQLNDLGACLKRWTTEVPDAGRPSNA